MRGSCTGLALAVAMALADILDDLDKKPAQHLPEKTSQIEIEKKKKNKKGSCFSQQNRIVSLRQIKSNRID